MPPQTIIGWNPVPLVDSQWTNLLEQFQLSGDCLTEPNYELLNTLWWQTWPIVNFPVPRHEQYLDPIDPLGRVAGLD